MLRRISCTLAFVLLAASLTAACNIPVFRYALERWHPDKAEIIAFVDGQATNADQVFLQSLDDASSKSEGSANVELLRVKPAQPGDHAELWKTLTADATPTLPYFVARAKVKDRPIVGWHGSGMRAAKDAKLLNSPVREELHKRLLKGDSIVWLFLKSEDKDHNESVRRVLTDEFKKLEKQLKLPEGIGEPGSELYADIPVMLNFSILEIDPADKSEIYLTQLLTGFHPKETKGDWPIVAPVFGRGRALEVLSGETLDGKVVKELTEFLCGACSCKVKGLNPGFDLLMSASWDDDLFGVDGERPNDNASSDETPLPVLISIPAGRKKKQRN